MRVLRAMAFGAIMLTGAGGFASAQAPAAPPPAIPMTLASSAFADGGVIPDKYTQASSTTPVSPALSWDNVPAGTASFALIMHDPDVAPNKGSADVLHWMAFNIPAAARALPENVPTTAQLPDGTIQPNNLRGSPGFMGPGARGVYHHYTFELYALDTKLNLAANVTRPELLAAMDGHIIGKAAYVGRFHR
ncbi:MAG: YbhB/YbcL family Raf kinase inhibitor-like protein [Rhizomicrobium sp.]